jgi:hypothetical protein
MHQAHLTFSKDKPVRWYVLVPANLIFLTPLKKIRTGIKPFYLHLFPEHLAHICPIRALAQWLCVSEITEGYLFRKMSSGDRVSTDKNSHMVRSHSRGSSF